MLLALMTLACAQAGPPIADLDKLAQAKNVEGLDAYLASPEKYVVSPFRVLRTGGGYDVGRFGWHAAPLGSEFVVVWTKLTSEDIGELVFRRVGGKLEFVPEAESFGIKLIRHDIDLKFDVPNKKATLVDRLKLSNAGGGAGSFFFRMSPQYVVSSITENGTSVPFSETAGVVSTRKPKGETIYTIKYSAVVDLPNYAGSISAREATLTNDYWYPMVARQPVPYDIAIHGPANWLNVGQGDLIEDKVVGDERVSRYKMDLPCVFYSVCSGPFKKFSQVIHGKTYSCWSAEMSHDEMEAQTEFYAPIIEFYERFAPFPFKGYGAVDSAVYGGGALEAYSFTTWGHGGLPSEDAHEPSHTWWGGMINNPYLTSFWNESFADFSEGLYHRGVPIGNVAERSLAFIRDGGGNPAYDSISIEHGGPEVGPASGSLGYGKGAQVLQMLEQIIGTEKIVVAMKEWIRECKGTDSDWPAFESVVLKQNPEKNLKSFFDDWIRKPGYAELKVTPISTTANSQIALNVEFGGQSYRMPLEVMMQFSDGSRQFQTLDVTKPGIYALSNREKPTLISVDPWRRALRKIDQNETPTQLSTLTASLPRFTDPTHKDYLEELKGSTQTIGTSSSTEGKFIVGHPASMPMLKSLCDKVGFKVDGNKLTYDGTTIDLNHGCAMAVVDLGEGKRCVIGLGKTRCAPDPGRARLVLTDDLGRFLRGKTDPKTSGNLTFRLN